MVNVSFIYLSQILGPRSLCSSAAFYLSFPSTCCLLLKTLGSLWQFHLFVGRIHDWLGSMSWSIHLELPLLNPISCTLIPLLDINLHYDAFIQQTWDLSNMKLGFMSSKWKSLFSTYFSNIHSPLTSHLNQTPKVISSHEIYLQKLCIHFWFPLHMLQVPFLI